MLKTYTPIPIQLKAACWLDGSDTRTITSSSGSVTKWSDKSGNGLNGTSSSNNPTTGTNTQNGLNVISFNSSNTATMALPNGLIPDLSVVNSACHVFMVANCLGSNNKFFFGNAATNRFVIQYASTTQLDARFGSTNVTVATGFVPTSPFVTDAYYSQSALAGSCIVNNGTVFNSATVSYTAAPTGNAFGLNALGSGIFGWIAEFIVFNYALSTTQITQVFRYLGAKWGITVS